METRGDTHADLTSDMGLLQQNLREVNLRIEKQNKIMALQSKLIIAAPGEDTTGLREQLDSLLSSA